jgi:putative mRNA 3-end processing factor
LGKCQRILKNIDASIGKIFVHGAVDTLTQILRNQQFELPPTTYVTNEMKKKDFEGSLVLCPPSAIGSPWLRKFDPYSLGIASGMDGLRGARRRRGADRGFVLSDHADWTDLNRAVLETGAQRIFVTHGYSEVFAHWLSEKGFEAKVIKTQFEGELGEIAESGIDESKTEAA